MILKDKDIILISNQMMDDRYWTSKQYITEQLIKENRVLYVEANYSFGKLFYGLMGKKWPVTSLGRLTQDSDNLFILTPIPRLPLRNHFRWIGWLNQKLLRCKINKAVTKLKMSDPILWTFLHQTADIVGTMNESTSVYHCVDDWPVLLSDAGMGNPSVIKTDEQELISKVDTVFRVSPKLLTYTDASHTNIADIPNGVDTNLFDPKTYEGAALPDDLQGLSHPIIGFSGSVGKWIDIDLIIETAKHFTKGSVVLIGLNEKHPNIQLLSSLNNVHFLGMKKRKDVPKYILGFDVCLMPFSQGEVGEGLVPLKMFEYLAMGKPIVTIASKALIPFQNVMYCTQKNEFINGIETALSEWDHEKRQSTQIFADTYSWKNRIREYDRVLEKIINDDRNLS